MSEDSGNSSSFRVEARGAGTAIITITSTDQRTGERATAECAVTVTGAAPAAETSAAPEAEAIPDAQELVEEEEEKIAIESITIEPKIIFLKIGATRQLNFGQGILANQS